VEGVGRFVRMPVSALIAQREGIAGSFNSMGTAWNSAPLSGASPGQLARLDPRLRRFLFESELLSSLYFASDATLPVGWATLWSFTENGTATGTVRPAGTWSQFLSMQPPNPGILNGSMPVPNQLSLVAGYADLRTDRAREIVAQMSPQYAFWASVVPLNATRHRYTLELVGLALRLAKYVEMNFKNAMSVRRPNEYSPQIQPMIQTPTHASLPSGHSTETHAVAGVLFAVAQAAGAPPAAIQQLREQLTMQAARIAINRTVAGLHYPIDSMAGQFLGLAIAQYIVARALPAPQNVEAWTFDGANYPAGQDFSGTEIFNRATGQRVGTPYHVRLPGPGSAFQVRPAPGLNWLWNQAVPEW